MLTKDVIFTVLSEVKGNQKEVLKLSVDKIKTFILFEKKIKNDKIIKNDAIKMNAYVIIL